MQDERSIQDSPMRPSSQDPISVMLALRSRILKHVASSGLLLIPPQSGGSVGGTFSMQPVLADASQARRQCLIARKPSRRNPGSRSFFCRVRCSYVAVGRFPLSFPEGIAR